MTGSSLEDEACHKLFSDYPLAVTPINLSGTIRSMTLMFGEGFDAEFFVLSQDCSEGWPSYSLRPWPGEYAANIDTRASFTSDADSEAVACGIPIPRHGSLLGWACGNHITALLVVYAKYSPTSPKPYWAVMPFAGIPETLWPPFTDECFFGRWFWQDYWDERIRPLDDLIAGTPATVFWADTKAIIGSDCCAVARNIKSPDGHILRRGRYVYYQALRAHKPVPPLRTLLEATDKTDLASRFHRSEHHRPDHGAEVRADCQEQYRQASIKGGAHRNRRGEKSGSALFARFRHTAQR